MSLQHAQLNMSWIHPHFGQKDGYLTYTPPFPSSGSSGYTDLFNKQSTPSSSSGTRISPAVLFIIVILAVLFFISGLLHLLLRFLRKRPSPSASPQSNSFREVSGSDALQRQLQQLFHLHDSGLDQAFIDSLPVFEYKDLMGPKEPFDCAVCLCEFSEMDKLRLLPMCSHAFHMNCIDTWLLSNSTCPLCRGTLLTSGFPMENLMFELDDFRDEDGVPVDREYGLTSSHKTAELEEIVVDKGVVPVRLGKFRKLNGGEGEGVGETSSSNLDARRCYSMGSYQYVLGNSNLGVALNHEQIVRDARLAKLMERNVHSPDDGDVEGKKITSVPKGESYSVSKIWLWDRRGKFSSSGADDGMPSSLTSELPWMRKSDEDSRLSS